MTHSDAARHVAANTILQYFAYGHLPPHLQAISKPVGDLAQRLNADLPDGPEKTAGLRKLLEAKDCFVRTAMPEPPPANELPGFDPSRDQALGYSEGRLVWFDKSPG